jgi:hypothetical protein
LLTYLNTSLRKIPVYKQLTIASQHGLHPVFARISASDVDHQGVIPIRVRMPPPVAGSQDFIVGSPQGLQIREIVGSKGVIRVGHRSVGKMMNPGSPLAPPPKNSHYSRSSKRTIIIITTNLGPLTENDAIPTIYYAQLSSVYKIWTAEKYYLLQGPPEVTSCYPDAYVGSAIQYYSPGVCPAGFMAVCVSSAVVGTATDTIYTCCGCPT